MEQPSAPLESMPSQSTPQTPPTNSSSHRGMAVVAYLFGWVSGVILFFTTKDRDVKFHAAQSTILFGALQVLQWLFWSPRYAMMGGSPGMGLLSLVVLVLWIVLILKAYKGERYKLPLIGDWAESWANKQ